MLYKAHKKWAILFTLRWPHIWASITFIINVHLMCLLLHPITYSSLRGDMYSSIGLFVLFSDVSVAISV